MLSLEYRIGTPGNQSQVNPMQFGLVGLDNHFHYSKFSHGVIFKRKGTLADASVQGEMSSHAENYTIA